jgi:hypothetical protein
MTRANGRIAVRLAAAIAVVVGLAPSTFAAVADEEIRTPTPARRVEPLAPIEDESWRLEAMDDAGPMWSPGDGVSIEVVPEDETGPWLGEQTDLFVPDDRWRLNPQVTSGWTWTLLPSDLIYRSYLAGPKESRFRVVWAHDDNLGWMWDITLGGRVGILRYGSADRDGARPQGFQLDIEGAAFPRLDPDEDRDLVSADFRFGVPLTFGIGRYQTKLAYYHLSSHIGDEYLIKNPTFERRNYVRDEIVWGHSFFVTEDLRLYGEIGVAFYKSGGADPIEIQTGVEYSPAHFTGIWGAPFAAVNGLLREEFNYGGGVNVQAGWQWRGSHNRRLFRVGGEYSNGKSEQFEFFDQNEERLGIGMWFDY